MHLLYVGEALLYVTVVTFLNVTHVTCALDNFDTVIGTLLLHSDENHLHRKSTSSYLLF